MPNYLNPTVQLNGMTELDTNPDEMYLVQDFSTGDDYATVESNRVSTKVVLAAGDVTVAQVGLTHVITVVAKSASATADIPAPAQLHTILSFSSGTKIYAAGVTTNQAMVNGAPVNFPQWTITCNQPP